MTQIPFCPSCEFFLAPVERLTRRNVYIRTVYAHRVTRGGEVYFVHPSKFMLLVISKNVACTHICIRTYVFRTICTYAAAGNRTQQTATAGR